jgi:transcriptional regulator with XRE-family HTH domain
VEVAVPSGPRRRGTNQTGPLDHLGALATRRRLVLSLTQHELADLAGVGVSSVRALEAGQETLTLAVALQILKALGLAVAAAPLSDLSTLSTAVLLRAPDVPTAGVSE